MKLECRKPCVPRDLIANRIVEQIVVLYRKEDQHDMEQGKILDKIPVPFYRQMKDKQIADLVVELNLPKGNSREENIGIHKEYVLRMNAQCDSLRPKSRRVIVHEIRNLKKDNYRLEKENQDTKRKLGISKKDGFEKGCDHDFMKMEFRELTKQILRRKKTPLHPREMKWLYCQDVPSKLAILKDGRRIQVSIVVPSAKETASIKDISEVTPAVPLKVAPEADRMDVKLPLKDASAVKSTVDARAKKILLIDEEPQSTTNRVNQNGQSSSSYDSPSAKWTNGVATTPSLSTGSVFCFEIIFLWFKQCVGKGCHGIRAADIVDVFSTPLKKLALGKWECNKCTLSNSKYDLRCIACDSRRGTV